jgi:predicted RND superfamily exporter protein
MKNYNELQDRSIDELKAELKRLKENPAKCLKMFLQKQTAIILLTVMITLIGTLFGYSISAVNHLDNKVEKNNAQFASIQAQLSSIQTDLVWIKRELNGR